MESLTLPEPESNAHTPPSSIDLNQASREELTTLPGIGPALAGRIVTRREEIGPFASLADLETIAGIGPSLVEGIADRVTVVPIESEPEFGVDLATDETPPPLPVMEEPEPDEELIPASPFEEEEEPVRLETFPALTPEELSEEADDEAVDEPEEEGPPPPETVPAAPPPPEGRAAEPRRGTWVWPTLLGAVLGGLLGLALTVLLFAGINGALDMSRSRAFRTLSDQINGLSVEIDAVRGDVSTLQGDLNGLRQRVEVLSGLTARMETVERTLETFTGAINTLQQETDALQTDVTALEEAVDAVEVQTEKAMSFFERLRDMLNDLFGAPEEVDK